MTAALESRTLPTITRTVAALLATLLVGVSFVMAAPAAQAARISPVVPEGSGYTQTFTQPNVDPVVATYSFSGATVASGTQQHPDRGSSVDNYSEPIPAGTDVAWLLTSADCPAPGGDFDCPGRGTVTITFDRPVDNPTVHIAGLGAGQANAAFHAVGTLTSAPAGATMSVVGDATNLEVVNGGTTFQAGTMRASPSCSTINTGYDGLAGCGSLQVAGTGITELTFDIALRGNNSGAATTVSSDEGWSMIVTLEDEPDPSLTVLKSADVEEITAAGQEITYSFEVTNTGNVALSDVAPVEGDFSGSGELGEISPESVTLAPGESAVFNATYEATQEDIDAGGITNTATATGTPPGDAELPPVPPSEVTVPAASEPGLSVLKSASPSDPDAYVAGQVIVYSFEVTNTGNVTITDVAPEEADFTGTGELGEITPESVALAPGEEATFTASYVVTQADIDAGGVTNTATATGTPPGGVELPPVPPSEVTVPAEAEPALSVVKSAEPEEVSEAEQEILYSFVVTNTGNVTITDAAPVEGDFSGSGELGEITPESVTLAPGEEATFTASYVVTQADIDAGGITNTATATGTPPGDAELPPVPPSEVTVPAASEPGLSVVKSGSPSDPDSYVVGQEIVYSFEVTNTGNVTITDAAPVEGDFSGSGELGEITPESAILAPGESATFTAEYTLTQDDINEGGVTNTATATGTPPGDVELPPVPPSEVEIPVASDPSLSVVKSADLEEVTEAEQEIVYSFVVTNTGNVTITDAAPVEGDFSGSGELGEITPESVALAPGEEATFTASYVVTQADIDAGGVTNTATATGTPPGGVELPPVPPSEVTVPAEAEPALSVVKSAEPEEVSEAEQEILYSFVVTNTGNVTITDAAPVEGDFSGSGELGEITPESVALAPGEEATFTASYVVTQADIDAGGVTNTATATGTPPGGVELPPVPPSEVTVPAEAEPALSVVKSAEPEEVSEAEQEILYSFVVTNTGNVTITDAAPVEGDFSGSGELGEITPESVTLAPGEEATFTASYVVTQADIDAGGITNTATATGTPPGGVELPPVPPSEVTVPAEADPSLTVVKSAEPEEVTEAEQEILYSFVVTNTGNVTITDAAPVEGDFSGTGELGEITPESVTLAPGEEATFTASYVVTQADIDAGGITNTATATGAPPGGVELPPVPPSEVTVPAASEPGLSVVKSAEPEEVSEAEQEIVYSFVVTNTGNVTITDAAPVEGEFSGSGELGEITPESVTLAPGEEATFSASYVVTQADIDAGGITNTATATGTPPGGVELPPVPPSEVTVPAEPDPGLTVVKSSTPSDPDSYVVGQEILYSFVVTNTGNVTITDAAPVEGDFSGTGDLGEITPESVILAPGESATFTAEYTLTQADVDAGNVTNTASATGTPPGDAELPPVPPSENELPILGDPSLTVVKSADLEEVTEAEQEIVYSFVVTNTGNVTVTDAAPVEGEFSGTGELGEITPESVTLIPGEEATFTASYVVTQADIDAGGITNTATATGTPPGDAELPPVPPSEVTVPAVLEPGLGVVKSSTPSDPDSYLAGQEVVYSFVVTNTGNTTLTDVAPVEGEFSGSGELGEIAPESVTLAPGESATFTAEYTLTQADVDAGGVTNTATATGTPPGDVELPPVPPSENEFPVVSDPSLTVVKSAEPEEVSEAGDEIVYSFVVTNAGNVTITDVAPVEGDFTGTGELGEITPESVTLIPGESATFTADYTLTQADIDAGGITNTATATGTPPGDVELPPVPPSEVTVPAESDPSLTVVKSAEPEEVSEAGDEIVYSFVVTNTGNVTITDAAPVEGDFTGTGELGEITPESVTLIPGESATFTADYTLTQADIDAGGITNTATATGTPPGDVELPPVPPSEVTVPAESDPSLSVVKSAEPEEVSEAGDEIVYSFVVTNTGNVTITDAAPVEGEFTGSGELGAITPESVSLAPGESATFTAEYTLTQADIDAGGITNTATATGTPPGDVELPPVPPSEVTVPAEADPGLSVVKSASPSDPDSYVVGQEIVYSFVVTNTGNVTITDAAPVEGEFTGTGELGEITPESVTLIPGESATFTAEYTLTQADVDAGGVTNTATATGTPPGDVELPPVPPSENELPVLPEPGLMVIKTADVHEVASAGQEILYSFVVTNTGNVTITDAAPVEGEFTGTGELGEITPESVTLIPGESATFTAEYTLTQADIDAGGVTNTATATGTPPGDVELPPVPPSEYEVPALHEPDLTVVKTADLDEVTASGEEIVYSFVVSNTGNVTLTDVAPVEGEFSGTGELGEIVPVSVTLAPGESATFTAEYTVTTADLTAATLVNTATATGTPPRGGPMVSDPSSTSTAVSPPDDKKLPSTGVQPFGLIGLAAAFLLTGAIVVRGTGQRRRS
ncbi:DUF7507 domain-containing protein [Bogoriella caseilytica]|uniref:Putative repeat protein (TIGR01451 family) n=1 Tax=Bogoriella caseilytica TaxID=56055 RepID=A0A3N2BEA6_9MICO|nr:DUF11 domain-containing protein [Bogoriella caseilytica]ROR73586.1 putative repeat protein (TIGR01451 family) [Bogoriella caseilytica]